MSSFQSGAFGGKKSTHLDTLRVQNTTANSVGKKVEGITSFSKDVTPQSQGKFTPILENLVADTAERYLIQQGNLFRKIPGRDLYRKVNTSLPIDVNPSSVIIAINPLNPNDVWIALGEHGLLHTVDGGLTLDKIPQVSKVDSFEVRKNKKATNGIEIRFNGHIEGIGRRYFLSLDAGVSWMTSLRSAAIDLSKRRFN